MKYDTIHGKIHSRALGMGLFCGQRSIIFWGLSVKLFWRLDRSKNYMLWKLRLPTLFFNDLQIYLLFSAHMHIRLLLSALVGVVLLSAMTTTVCKGKGRIADNIWSINYVNEIFILHDKQETTSILRVLLKQYMSPTGPNKPPLPNPICTNSHWNKHWKKSGKLIMKKGQ